MGVTLAAVILFGFLEGWFFQFRSDLPPFANFLLFALINLNVLLLLLLAYLVLRNLVKLTFERKKNLLGSRIRTRLVIAFVCLTLIPTIPLFGLATKFISFSLDYWFSQQVEQSLKQSVALGKDLLQAEKEKLVQDVRALLQRWPSRPGNGTGSEWLPRHPLSAGSLAKYHLDGAFVVASDKTVGWQRWRVGRPLVKKTVMQRVLDLLGHDQRTDIVTVADQRQAVVALLPVGSATGGPGARRWALAVMRWVPADITRKLHAVTAGYENYLQLKLLQHPFKVSHFILFSIVTLLVMFAAVWFAFYLAKSITVPVQGLLAATERIAEGDLNVHLEWEQEDEVGSLVRSFNKMVRDLRESRQQLAGAYEALQASHVELEQRRRYMEIVLANIGAGVVSVDADGVIVTLNKAAERMFGLKETEVAGKSYAEVVQPHHMEIVKSFVDMYQMSRQRDMEQRFQVIIGNRPMLLLTKVSVLLDDHDRYLGIVAVFDDLTELEKAHRMAAWREVARRIAHEIKNPLTPIQLSAQRLRRRYAELLDDEDGVFDECTKMIVEQVDQMKRLVNEFSGFARMPQANPAPCRIVELVEEVLKIYRHSYPRVSFEMSCDDEDFPILTIDRSQFRQVMINILDNAVHALDGAEKRVEVRLFYDKILKIARLEFADTGCGLPVGDKLRIFEPYYSTKPKGTGLGLAIVANIVADHHGFVRVRDNVPQGTVIIIELPL